MAESLSQIIIVFLMLFFKSHRDMPYTPSLANQNWTKCSAVSKRSCSAVITAMKFSLCTVF